MTTTAPEVHAVLSGPVPRWAVRVAHLIPFLVLPSSVWRLAAWVAGPGGPYHASTWDPATGAYMVVLSAVSEGLALLAFGLVRPWGEVVPAWIPLLGGRRLPTHLVVLIAGLGGWMLVLVAAYAVVNNHLFHVHPQPLIGGSEPREFDVHGPALWVAVACYAPLAAWGPLLLVLTNAYHRRRNRAEGRPPVERSPSPRPSTRGRRGKAT